MTTTLHFNKRLLILGMLSGFMPFSMAQALDVETNPVVVTGTRQPLPVSQISGTIDVLTPERIQEAGAITLPQALVNVPNVDVSDPFNPLDNKISIRGFSPLENVYLVDGVVDADSNMAGNVFMGSLVDPFFIKAVEIKKGTASTLYGAGAIGGVINVTTLSAKDLLRNDETWGSRLTLGHNSLANTRHVGNLLYGKTASSDLLVGLTYLTGENTKRARKGKVKNEHLGQKGVMVSGNLYAENLTLNLKANANRAHMHRATSSWDGDDVHARLGLTYAPTDTLTLTTHLGHTYRTFEYANDRVHFKNTFNGTHFTVNGQSLFDLGAEHALNVSLDLNDYRQHGEEENPVTSTMTDAKTRPHGEGRDIGVSLEDAITLGRWEITPALRFTHYKRTSKTGLGSISGHHVSPALTVGVTPMDNLRLWSAYSEGFRPATLDELYFAMEHPMFDWVVVPNPNLKPETAKTLEVGLDWQKKGLLTPNADALHVRVSAFVTRLKNGITIDQDFVPPNPPTQPKGSMRYQTVNLDRVERKGLEMAVDYRYENATAALTVGLLKAKDRDTGETPYGVSPAKVGLRLGYTVPKLQLETWYRLNMEWLGEIEPDFSGALPTDTKRKTVHAVGASWKKKVGKTVVTVNGAINNLFNQRYRRTNKTLGTGRSVNLWMTVQF